ncbi:hypothetical protein GCM10008904_14270 [Paraclostridium ghonii]
MLFLILTKDIEIVVITTHLGYAYYAYLNYKGYLGYITYYVVVTNIAKSNYKYISKMHIVHFRLSKQRYKLDL